MLACGLGCFAVAFADVGKGHADDDDDHRDFCVDNFLIYLRRVKNGIKFGVS
ncbi:MAG: hypothetical protein ACI30P_02865 [Muribaculaceae bacterium]